MVRGAGGRQSRGGVGVGMDGWMDGWINALLRGLDDI